MREPGAKKVGETAFLIGPIRHQIDANSQLPQTLNKMVLGVFYCLLFF